MILQSLFEYNESYTHDNWRFEHQKLNFSKIYYIIGGSGYYQDAEHDVRFQPGRLYLLPAKKEHTLYDEPDDKLNHLYLHLYTDPAIDTFLEWDPATDPFLADLIALIRKWSREPNRYRQLKALAESLLNYLFDQKVLSDSMAFHIKQYLEEHILEPFSMQTLSSVFDYSPSHIVKCFKKAYLVTPKQYFETLKFEEILKGLQSGKTCEELSWLFHFSSPANLSRDFKNKFGLSPRHYLKLHPTL